MIPSLGQQAGACSGPAFLSCRPQKLQGKLAVVGERGGVIVNGIEMRSERAGGESQACFCVGPNLFAVYSPRLIYSLFD